jgi:hypothetical protein
MWWPKYEELPTNVPVSIKDANGTHAITVNQQNTGGQWVYIGNYFFSEGTANYVQLSPDNINSWIVIADAIKLVPNYPTIPSTDPLPEPLPTPTERLSFTPNPVSNEAHIHLGNSNQLVEVSIRTSYGETIFKGKLYTDTRGTLNMNIKDLQTGYYIVTITRANGLYYALKMIKE